MVLTKEMLSEFLVQEMGLGAGEFTDSTPLFSTGLLDSFCMVNLLAFVEKRAGIKVGATDVNLDNLDTVERVVHYVARRISRDTAQ
jgi:acyl carrier protein